MLRPAAEPQAVPGPRPGGGRGRQSLALLLVAVGAALLLLALPLDHGRRNLLDRDAFADHATAVLSRGDVRRQLEAEITDAIVARSPGALAGARPRIRSIAAAVVASPAFRRTWRTLVRRAQTQVLDPRRQRITITVDDLGALIARALGQVPTDLAPLLRDAGQVELVSWDRGADGARLADRAEQLGRLGLALLVLALASFAAALVLAQRRGRTAVAVGVAAAAASVAVLVAERVGRAAALDRTAPGSDRQIAATVWDELLGGLRTTAVAVLIAGIALALVARLVGRGATRTGGGAVPWTGVDTRPAPSPAAVERLPAPRRPRPAPPPRSGQAPGPRRPRPPAR